MMEPVCARIAVGSSITDMIIFSGIKAILEMKGETNASCLRNGPRLLEKPINQRDLAEADSGDASPGQPFTKAQAALARFGEPELDFARTDLNQVSVPQKDVLRRLAVNAGNGIRQ